MSKADENVAVIPHSDVMRAKMPATPADFFWILFISFHVNHPLKIFNLFCQASRISCFVTQKYYPFFLPYGQTPILYTFQQGVLQQALLTQRRALWYLSVANVPDVPSCHQVFRLLRGCRLKQLFSPLLSISAIRIAVRMLGSLLPYLYPWYMPSLIFASLATCPYALPDCLQLAHSAIFIFPPLFISPNLLGFINIST